MVASPRLGMSFPVTETSKVYFNYGWFYQRPSVLALYQINRNATTLGIPDLNLGWPRTIQMEFGYEQNVYGWFLLHAAGYFKDVQGEQDFVSYTALSGFTIDTFDDTRWQDIRGFEFRVDKNYGLFRTRLNYNYLIRTRGVTGSRVGYQDLKAAADESTRTRVRLEGTRAIPTPTFRATAGIFTPRNWGPQMAGVAPLDNITINVIARWEDGGQREVTGGVPPVFMDIVNYTNTDLYATKRVNLGNRLSLGATMQIYNLFNTKRLVFGNAGFAAVESTNYTETIVEPTDVNPVTGKTDAGLGVDKWREWDKAHLSAVLPFYKDYFLFENKRDVFFGITVSFN